MSNPILDEARRIAGQPTSDKLDGKQGEEARDIAVRLMEEAGLDFMEAHRLLQAFEWSCWHAGYRSGRDRKNGS